MNAFNYIIDKREPSAEHKQALEKILAAKASSTDNDGTNKKEAEETNISNNKKIEVVPLPNNIDGCLLLNVLSPDECNAIVSECERIGYTFWANAASGDEEEKKQNKQNDDEDENAAQSSSSSKFRTAHTIEVNLPTMSRVLWKRIEPFVTPTVDITPDDEETYQRDLEGKWHADGFCENLLFAKYMRGGHFAPHVDGQSVITFNRRSMYTALFYLNDCDGGGETVFHSGDQCKALKVADDGTGKVTGQSGTATFKVQPRRGAVVVFRFDVLHEGAPVAEEEEVLQQVLQPDGTTTTTTKTNKYVKYIIRGDVEFERRPKVCDDENGRKAFDMYERARKLEAEGDTDGAMRLFRSIRRVSQELAAILQLL